MVTGNAAGQLQLRWTRLLTKQWTDAAGQPDTINKERAAGQSDAEEGNAAAGQSHSPNEERAAGQ